MNEEIKEIVRLNCEEEIDVKYFAKDDSLVYTTMDYSQLLDYITNLQNENERLNNMLENDSNKNLELIVLINKISDIVEDKNITGIEVRLKIQEILGGDE